jgi:hypothetical protein
MKQTDAEGARAIAERERRAQTATDASLRRWNDASAGTPVLVHTIARVPSYWLVPVEAADQVVGFVRITLDGHVAAAGRFGGSVSVVTGITADEARVRAASSVDAGATVGDPIFVHDGPPGREGWRVDVTERNGVNRILLVTAGGVSQPTGGGEP